MRKPGLDSLARGQHGLFTRQQALFMGVASRTLDRRQADGVWTAVRPGVLAVPGAPATATRRLASALLACGPGAVLSHRTAAAIWDLEQAGKSMIEVTVPRWRGKRPEGIVLHRIADMDIDHIRPWEGLWVTNPARTLVDLGAVVPEWMVDRALEKGLCDHIITLPQVDQMLDELGRKGRTGVGVMRRVIDERALDRRPPDGMFEPRMARLIRDRGLPPAVFQHPVVYEGRPMRIDFAYPDRMLAIEVDGYAWHRTREQLQDSNERQNLLVEAGWRPLRFTWRDVVKRPREVAARIRRLFSA